jgi:anti-anti-sigma regulatory factor
MTPPKAVAPKPPSAIASPAPVTPTAIPPMPVTAEGEFEDNFYDTSITTAEVHSAVEEAAILYANERIAEAIATLHGFIKENTEARDLHPWMLLFDLYQVQNMKQPFDELSMDFVVRFERSAPVWEGPRQAATATKSAPKRSMASSVQLKGQVGAAQAEAFMRMLTLAESENGVKLDVLHTTGIDPEQAARFAQVLQTIRRAEQRIAVAGANEFAQILKNALTSGAQQEKAYWALLFELYQLSGQQNAFEDAAIDYAVTFELSPPSWEALPESVQTTAVIEPEVSTVTEEAEYFTIEGVLASGTDYKLRDLERYADARTQVQIDMTATARVDFVTVGAFINTLIGLNQKGKQVSISGANEMVHALFDVMGVTEYATVIRRKQR